VHGQTNRPSFLDGTPPGRTSAAARASEANARNCQIETSSSMNHVSCCRTARSVARASAATGRAASLDSPRAPRPPRRRGQQENIRATRKAVGKENNLATKWLGIRPDTRTRRCFPICVGSLRRGRLDGGSETGKHRRVLVSGARKQERCASEAKGHREEKRVEDQILRAACAPAIRPRSGALRTRITPDDDGSLPSPSDRFQDNERSEPLLPNGPYPHGCPI
jgi:hypothetical protein